MRAKHPGLLLAFSVLALASPAPAQTTPPTVTNPYPYAPNEPRAKELSLSRGAEYLDGVARFWMRDQACGGCHANFAFLMARPLLTDRPTPLVAETRKFLEQRQPGKEFSFDAEAVSIAFALAWDDARAGARLQPATRRALGRMWSRQRPDGSWARLGCGELIPAENDRHYTAALAALAAGVAPDGYARALEAQDGLTRLRRYFHSSPPRTLHAEAMLLWASLYVEGLMTADERGITVQALLQRQNTDGGWSFDDLALAPKKAGPDRQDEPSDGYSTAFVIYVLRQAGTPALRTEMQRGLAWLRSHQRASGRWFTPTSTDETVIGVGTRDLYAQNHATAFAVLALKACEPLPGSRNPAVAAILELADTLERPDVAFRAKGIVDFFDSCDISAVFQPKEYGGAGVGSAGRPGERSSIQRLVSNWAASKPPSKDELETHRQDLLKVARVLQAMAELAPHRMQPSWPQKQPARAEGWRKVSADFKVVTRAFRDSIDRGEPGEVRRATVNLQRTCVACHEVAGL
jgi:squalene-hopene/tetraprenyl-beta-curcumene cyclase